MDLYSEGRDVMVDSEQTEEPDDISEFEGQVKDDENPLFSLGSDIDRESAGGWGTATEARRRSW